MQQASSRNESQLRLAAGSLSLEGLDRLRAGDLVVFVGEDERPLEGAAGLADWRMLGFLTRQLTESRFEGKTGESLLTTPMGRLPVARVFAFGSGAGASADLVARALTAVAKAGGRDVALAPPGWGDGSASVAARELAKAAHDAGIDRLTLLVPDLRTAEKALAVVEDTFPWARLEEPTASKSVAQK